MTTRKRLLLEAVVLLLVLTLWGCGAAKLPVISGFHWRSNFVGADLYTKDGQHAASVVVASFGEPAQACIFLASGLHGTCEWFEETQQAYDYIAKRFAERVTPPTADEL